MKTISNRYQLLLKLIESAAEVFEVTDVDIMFAPSSKRRLCDVRDMICHIAKNVARIEVSMPVLAVFTGRKHHASIYHSIEKAEDLLFYDREFKSKYNDILSRYNEKISSQCQMATA